MKIGISHRLFWAIFAAAALSVAAMFSIMQWSIDRGFLRYVNNLEKMQLSQIAAELETDYAQEGSWDFVRNDRWYWRRLLMTTMPTMECPPKRPAPPSSPPVPGEECAMDMHHGSSPMQESRHFVKRLLVRDDHKNSLIGPAFVPPNTILIPLRFQGKTIGHLGLLPLRDLTETLELRFLKEQKLTLGLVGLAVVLVAAALAFPLAGRLIQPIKTLTNAVRKMAAGEFSARVTIASSDELGQLGQDFNLLALALEKNEKTRRQWVADISHELRTPLAVLRAEVEALQDGVRPTTPDSIRSLHGEVLRLNRLVDDLYQLSLSDMGGLTYRKESVNISEIITDALSLYRFQFVAKGIAVGPLPATDQEIKIFGDPERLQQLFSNILENSLKYTDNNGSLAIHLKQDGNMAVIDFQDSAPGVAETKLDLIFERLFRVESSRNRSEGGAGLGLAICKNIVEAHAGTISARPSPLGGVWIRITLPLEGTI